VCLHVDGRGAQEAATELIKQGASTAARSADGYSPQGQDTLNINIESVYVVYVCQSIHSLCISSVSLSQSSHRLDGLTAVMLNGHGDIAEFLSQA